MKLSIDIACAAAYWEAENHEYEESKKKSAGESHEIGKFMERYKEEIGG